jgi:hypothetical protein
MERGFKLPSGETIDVFESMEFSDFRWDSERYPLFFRNPDEYFSKKLGPEWPFILTMEKHALSYAKEHGAFASGCHKAKFVGKEGEFYVFDVSSYYDAGDGDHGGWDRRYKVRMTGPDISIWDERFTGDIRFKPSIIEGKSEDRINENQPLPEIPYFSKTATYLYRKAKEIVSSAFQ